jgi:two-component system CheB/CheR fusion protein
MGLDCDTAVGHVIYDIAPGIDNYKEGHRTALAGKSIDLRGVPYRRLGAEQDRYFDVSYRAIRDADGQVSGILAVVIDVTERHELDERKNEFIALTSHELKTPITAIKGYSQMALRTTGQLGDERLARTLRIIDEQTNRLIRLINELLDMSRMQGGMLTLNRQTLDLRHLALETVDAQELTAPDFAFDVDLPPEPVIASADRQRIEQVLVNLLQNAVKYSQSSPRVDVKMRVEGAEVVTSVRDYGVGIPAIDQEHIFERFFRASNVRERGSGLGLGLAISYGIVARHDGRMWLESHEGKGSTFYFALPLASAPSSG